MRIKNSEGKEIWCPLRYEKLLDFCYECGKNGHVGGSAITRGVVMLKKHVHSGEEESACRVGRSGTSFRYTGGCGGCSGRGGWDRSEELWRDLSEPPEMSHWRLTEVGEYRAQTGEKILEVAQSPMGMVEITEKNLLSQSFPKIDHSLKGKLEGSKEGKKTPALNDIPDSLVINECYEKNYDDEFMTPHNLIDKAKGPTDLSKKRWTQCC